MSGGLSRRRRTPHYMYKMAEHHDPALKKRKNRRTERTKRRANKRKAAAAGGAGGSGPAQDAQSSATAASNNVHTQGQNQPAVTAPIPAQMLAQIPTAMQMHSGMMCMHSAAASGQHNFLPPPPPPHQVQAYGMQQGSYVQGFPPHIHQGYVSYGSWGMPPPHAHSTFEAGVAEGRRQMWAQMQTQAQAGMGQHQWADQHQQYQQYQPDYMYQHQPHQLNYMQQYSQYQQGYQYQHCQWDQHYHQNQHQLQQHQQRQQQHGDDPVAADGSSSAPRVANGAAARDDDSHFHQANGGKAELGDDASTASTSSDANKKEDNASHNSANRDDVNPSSQTNIFNSKPPSVGIKDDDKDKEVEQHSCEQDEVLAQYRQENMEMSTTTSSTKPSGVNPCKKKNPSGTSTVRGQRKQKKKKSKGVNKSKKAFNSAKRNTSKGGTKLTQADAEIDPSTSTSTANVATTEGKNGKRIDFAVSTNTIDIAREVADLSTHQDTADTDRPRATSREKSNEKKNEKKRSGPRRTLKRSRQEGSADVFDFGNCRISALHLGHG